MRITPSLLNLNCIKTKKEYTKNGDAFNSDALKTSNFSSLLPLSNYNRAFLGRAKVAIYAINKITRKYERFECIARAASELGLNKRAVARCISGELNSTGGYAFLKAEDIEYELEDKKTTVDETKIKTMVDNLLSLDNNAVYAIKDGLYQRFETQAAASKTLKIDATGISNCISGKSASAGGYVFIAARDVENIDDRNEFVLDKEKLLNIVSGAKKSSRSLYSIDSEGNYEKFENPNQAATKLGINYHGVELCLKGEYQTSHNLVFAWAKDIETIDDNGKITVDSEKLQKLLKKFVSDKNPIYAIRISDGNCQRHNSQADAARELELDRHCIGSCLSGDYLSSHGYIFVRPEDVEKFKNGETKVSVTKVKKILFDYITKGVYAIKKDGSYQRFDSQKDASEALGIEASRISACINGRRKSTDEYAFESAQALESFNKTNARVVVDTERIEKIAKARLASKEVYVVDRFGRYKKFPNRKEASVALSVDASDLTRHLRGEHDFSKDIRFVNANQLEVPDENGDVSIDREKIENIKYRIEKRSIYLIKPDGTHKRLPSKWYAAKTHQGLYFNFLTNKLSALNGYGYVGALTVDDKGSDGIYRLNLKKLEAAAENLRQQAVYVYHDESGISRKFNNRFYAATQSGAFKYNKILDEFEIKKGFYCVRASNVETLNENGKYCFDEVKMQEQVQGLKEEELQKGKYPVFS